MQFSVTCTKGLKSSGVTATAAALPRNCALVLSNHLYNNEALGQISVDPVTIMMTVF